jgi:UMF1 family MFS transporter
MVHLAPAHRAGEFFGVYGLVGKASQVVGQLLYGAIVFLTFDALGIGAYQLAVLSLIVTMLIGAWLIAPIEDHREEAPHEHPSYTPLPRLEADRAPLEDVPPA